MYPNRLPVCKRIDPKFTIDFISFVLAATQIANYCLTIFGASSLYVQFRT